MIVDIIITKKEPLAFWEILVYQSGEKNILLLKKVKLEMKKSTPLAYLFLIYC